jgi:dTDP-4-amino-4,6-dideoxygalactose transaminase
MDAVLTQLVEERIGPGEQAEKLLQIAKDNIHFDFALAMRSPAAALVLALRAFAAADGARGVVVSALSPLYYARAIEEAGLIPVFCDVEDGQACVSAEKTRASVEGAEPVCCILLHETLGFMPEMRPLLELGIPVIEDCSASYGARLGEERAGTFGVFVIMGIEERDMITGGGGALLYAMERRNASVLRSASPLPPEYGLPDMNAAMALVQLREASRSAEKRSEIARLYTDAALRGARHKLFARPDDFEYNNYAFPLVLESGMKEAAAYARKKEIEIETAFEHTLMGAGLVPEGLCPHARSLAMRTALFPIYPRLGAEAASSVARLIQTLP